MINNTKTKNYKIDHLERNGYKITKLGKNIKAEKKNESVKGSINSVHKTIFGY